MVTAWRVAARNPYVTPVRREQALAVRSGYGSGEEVANGVWTEASVLATDPNLRVRRSMLDPHAYLSQLIGGKQTPYLFEELILDSRLSLNGKRYRSAALQLDLALDVALEELADSDQADSLKDLAGEIETISDVAVSRKPDSSEIQTLLDAQTELERVAKQLAYRSSE